MLSSLLVLLQLSSTLGDAPSAQSVAATVDSQQQVSYLGDGGRLLEEKKPKRKFCNTTAHGNLKGDYAYEACGGAPVAAVTAPRVTRSQLPSLTLAC